MTFTDDDLKRLKEMQDKANNTPDSEALTGTMTATKEALLFNKELIALFPALLARLEAAEKVAGDMPMMENMYDCELDNIRAWRKAAGK